MNEKNYFPRVFELVLDIMEKEAKGYAQVQAATMTIIVVKIHFHFQATERTLDQLNTTFGTLL